MDFISKNRTLYILREIDWSKVSLILVVCGIVAVLSTLHVILGFAKIPPNTVYLLTGHYYLDYFYYLQFIAQGLNGYWLPRQYSATDDPSIYFHLQPYVLIGQLGRIIRVGPILAYWISVFLLILLLAGAIFLAIRFILKERPFYIQFSAFLISLFMGPFFIIDRTMGRFNLYDYWSSYSTLFKRFAPVPHHLLGYFFSLIALILFGYYLSDLKKRTIKKTLFFLLLISLLMIALLTFYPFHVIIVFVSISLTILFYVIREVRRKNFSTILSLIVLYSGILFIVFLAGVAVEKLYNQTIFFQTTKNVEAGWRRFIEADIFLKNIGPALIFSFLGFSQFLRKLSPFRIIISTFFVASVSLFYSNVDTFFNTHNGRFLSPLNYIFYGSLAALGIYELSSRLGKYKNRAFIVLLSTVLLMSLPPHAQAFKDTFNDRLNIFSPITYLPKGIVDGFKYLDTVPGNDAVLTTPSQFLGVIVPVFTDRKAYIARHSVTPNYQEKNIIAGNFYLGVMTKEQALDLLKKNNIGLVVWTTIEGYPIGPLSAYPFLKEIYKNPDMIVFEVISNNDER